MSEKEIRKKDLTVQLLRIVGAFLVIGTHIKQDNIINGNPNLPRIIISAITTDGVTIFWMILGFFFFKELDYRKKLINLLKRIVLPMALFSLVSFYFNDFLIGDSTFLQSVFHSKREYWNVIKDGALRAWNIIPGTSHLWYLTVYILLTILFPALNGVKEYFKNKKILLLISLFLVFLINDLTFNGLLGVSTTFTGINGASLFLLTGWIIYSYKEKIIRFKLLPFIGLVIYIGANIIRVLIQYKCYFLEYIVTEEPVYWYTSYSMISVIGIIFIIFGCEKILDKPIISNIINYLGRMTFSIYIIHMLILRSLNNRLDLGNRIYEYVDRSSVSIFKYVIIYSIIVFLISFILSVVISGIKRAGLSLYGKVKIKKEKD